MVQFGGTKCHRHSTTHSQFTCHGASTQSDRVIMNRPCTNATSLSSHIAFACRTVWHTQTVSREAKVHSLCQWRGINCRFWLRTNSIYATYTRSEEKLSLMHANILGILLVGISEVSAEVR